MGYDLRGHGGASFQWDSWRELLAVAVAFGWEPAGTVAPDSRKWNGGVSPVAEAEWSGTYFSNDYQEVTDPDARALSMALYRAVTALSTRQILTAEQARALQRISDDELWELADYSAIGGFAIG